MSDAAAVSDPTRARLLEAAAAVFAEKGYDGAGVAEIAKRAGYTTGAIYGRFRGKAELLLAALDAHTSDELAQLFASHRFDGHTTDILNVVGGHLVDEPFGPGQALLLEAFVAARRDPEVADLVRLRLQERSALIGELIEAARREGRIADDVDTDSIVHFCMALGFGFLLFGAVEAPQPDAGPWERLIALLVDALA